MRIRWLLSIAIVILALVTGAPSAHAVCTNPDGAAGSIVFNKDHQVMQYCDDTNWRQVGPGPRKPKGCTNVGDTCSDGTYFIGDIGAGAVYATNEMFESLETWNDGNTNYSTTGATSLSDGEGNTVTLVTADSDDMTAGVQPHNAAIYCNGLSAHGHSNWYLPARDELNLFWNDGSPVANVDESGSFYWSSFEASNTAARSARFSNGNGGINSKNFTRLLRCVRKEGTKPTSIVPEGLIGHWRLDETSGGPYVDSSVLANDATLAGGSVVSDSGRLSNSLIFGDSTSDELQAPTHPTYEALQDFTLSAWVRPSAFDGYLGVIEIEGLAKIASVFGQGRLSFRTPGWDTQTGVWNSPVTNYVIGQWTHIAVTYRYSAGTSALPEFYVDGVRQDDIGEAFAPSGSFTAPASAPVSIGNVNISNGSRPFVGNVDDIRIYDRVLSAEEIHYLYQSFDKNVKYDADRRVPKYFNGDDWVAMGKSKYVPNAVEFSEAESDNLQLTGAVSGLTGTKQFTYSMWFRRVIDRSISGCQTVLDMDEFGVGNRGVQLITAGDGRLAFQAYDSSGQNLLNIGSSSENFEDNRWYHIVGSFDISNPKPATRHVYVNGVLDQGNDLATISGPDIDFSTVNRTSFGSNSASSACGIDIEVADVWFDAGTYLDLSIEANRRKFIDEYGDPVFLGGDGSLPTGSAPDIFLSGDTDSWHTNKGTGGGFTENGALSDAITKPGGPFLPADGLVGYWKLDEVSGSSVIDYASGNNGTYRNSSGPTNVKSQSGVHGGALDFTGHRVALGAPDDLDFSGTNAFTISAWVKPGEIAGSTIFHRGANFSGNMSYFFGRYNIDNSRWRLIIRDGATNQNIFSPVGSVKTGQWLLMSASWDGTFLRIFENGVEIATSVNLAGFMLADNPTPVYQLTAIGGSGRHDEEFFQAPIDEVAVYGRALSAAEITDMYNAGICANPERLNGTIVYNADFNVMQYCDAVRSDDGWQAVGP